MSSEMGQNVTTLAAIASVIQIELRFTDCSCKAFADCSAKQPVFSAVLLLQYQFFYSNEIEI